MASLLDRIVARLDLPDVVARLSAGLSGADLSSLLLEVMRRRAAARTAPEVLRQYRQDRFVTPSRISVAALRRVEDTAFALLPSTFETLVLAPLLPLAAHASVATVHQNKVVSTVRNTEVAADPTNALALEAAARREKLRFPARDVDLAASQRVTRAQAVPGGGRSFAHFQLFGLVSAGRDSGGRDFERTSLVEHATLHARLALACGAETVELAVTSLTDATAHFLDALRAALAQDATRVHVRAAPERSSGRGYYRTLCFKCHASFAGDEAPLEIGDGGDVDWTTKLTSNGKERCFISGLGLDRLALAQVSR